MIDKFKDAFREEAVELLANLENTLLELEEHPRDMEVISAVFRTMHTIKGSSAMFGFDAISRFTHEVESVMDLLREGAFVADRALIDLTLEARDLVSTMLEKPDEDFSALAGTLVVRFKEHVARRREAHDTRTAELAEVPPLSLGVDTEKTDSGEGGNPADTGVRLSADETEETGDEEGPALSCWRIHFVPEPDVFLNGTKPLLLLDELRALGTISIVPLCGQVPPLSSIDPERCYVGWDITLTTVHGEDEIRDIFIFVEGAGELSITRIPEDAVGPKRIGEILVERGITSAEHIQSLMGSRKKLGELLVEEKVATEDQIRSALEEQAHLKKIREKGALPEVQTSSIRVASEKLDELVDLVGELVTLQARLFQTASSVQDGSLTQIAEQLERLVDQLRDNTMSIRMLPIGTTFSRFRRVVRDLSSELGKSIELETVGADTELDKTVIERLNDPLVHIIRNSVDHGIEPPEARVSAGKQPQGTVSLSARHSGAHVLIEIRDDGAGLDAARIQEKAVERGVIPSGANLSREELYSLIFAPGFSTAKTVTSVSGRGVGMDVVKREIDNLGGSVSVDSTPGLGTTVTLKIPLTLAIIDGLLVRIDREYFVIPLATVDGCIELKHDEIKSDGSGRDILTYRNEVLPFVSVRELFEVPGQIPEIEQIVVVNALDARCGFVVDQVIGDYQTVIKPLGRMFRQSEGLSGATILGDGTVALIVDVNRLSANAQLREEQRYTARKERVR